VRYRQANDPLKILAQDDGCLLRGKTDVIKPIGARSGKLKKDSVIRRFEIGGQREGGCVFLPGISQIGILLPKN